MRAAPLLVVFISLAAGCASGPSSSREAGPPRAPSEEEAGQIMAHARTVRAERGCAAAASAYRVVAAMGEGLEPAQHELGECLLSLSGATAVETALLRQEGVFWLTRAAHAGNARAQRALTLHYASGGRDSEARTEALKWAILYARNGEADLYGYQSLPRSFEPGLRESLGAEEIAAAEAFAAAFRPLRLPAYASPDEPKSANPRRPMMRGGFERPPRGD